MDFKSAAATLEFSLEDLGLKVGNRAPAKFANKTVLSSESTINIEHRICNAAIPIGCAIDDVAFVEEELSIEGFDVSKGAKRFMPKRPAWNFELSSGRLHHRETQSFKQWLVDVRELIVERGGYPPAFEQNLQVWRQLWRVLERCDVAVVVLDARHPLLHLPPALIYHITHTLQKPLVLVLNKLDAVEPQDAARWAEALEHGLTPGGRVSVVGCSSRAVLQPADFAPLLVGREALVEACHAAFASASPAASASSAQHRDAEDAASAGRMMIGLVGHPNVGKSSLVNYLIGGKVVSVKATPGHTKTLQTLILDERTCLCDSPGVVFPRLEVPREAQIVGMLVPISQVREPFSAIRWVMERSLVPLNEILNLRPVTLQQVLDLHEVGTQVLRLDIEGIVHDSEEGFVPWSPMLLCAQYAAQRGLVRGGRPDCMAAGKEILERVLDGRVSYSVRPPASLGQIPQRKADEGDSSGDEDDDWQVPDDEEYVSEPDEDVATRVARGLFETFGIDGIEIGSGSKASLKKIKNRESPNDSGLNFVIDSIIDNILTAIFLLECLLKILAWGFCIDQTTYLRDPWNVLDFVVVVSGVIGWLPGTADSGLSFLRLFRVLRPLRSLNAVPQMKVLVNTVISSVPRLGNVSVMGAFLFVVFGIIGTTLLTGIFYRQCREADPILVNACWSWNSTNEGRLCGGRNMCEAGGFCRGHEEDPIEDYRPIFPGGKQGFPWCEGSAPAKVFPETDFVHFDHIIGAVILVFQCMTLEGWTDLMYMVQDGFNTPLAWVYFLILVMITSFFMLNVALAVVDEARDDFEDGSSKNDTDLEDDVDMFESIADPDPVMWHESNFVRYAYRFAYWEPFTNFIMLIIAGNVISMMLEVFPPQVAWDPGLNICGKVFLGIFVFEMMVMLVALGPKGYVKNVSTAFDGAVVTVSIIEEIMGGSSGLKALRTLRFFRVLGKLAKKWQAFGILLKAMMHTGMALRYWLVLFILVLYIFTLMFIQFFALEFHFKDPDSLAAMDDSQGQMWCAGNEDRPWNYRQDCIPRAHFDTFLWGFVTIFQIMTGENWNTIMYAGMRSKGAGFSFLFVIIILFGQILFLSLFLSMLISKFDEVQDTLEEAAYRMNALNAASKSSGGLSASSSDLDQKKMGLPPQVESSSGPSFSITKKSSQVAPQPDDDELMECATSLDEDDEVPDPTTEAGKKIAGVFVKAEDEVPSPTTEAGKKIAGVFVRAVSRDLQSLKGTRESKEGVKKDFSPQRSLGSQRSLDSHKEKGKVLSPPALAKWPRGYSWFMMTTANPIRRLAHFLLVFEIRGCQVFDNFILVCILLNSLCMGIDNPLTDPSLWYSIMLRELDVIFSIIFIIEMALKVLAYPVLWGENAYLRSGWNVLDGTVVLVSILGFIAFEGAGTLKTLRIIRALRPLRVISRNQNLKVVVQTVFASLQDLVSLIIVFTLVLLIFALFALMYLNGQFYRCEEEVRFMTSDTDNFVTPLCLGGNILDSSVALGKWEPPYGWDTAGESCNGNLPMQWARASSDTPLCLARCDPLWESEVPPPAWLCPRKYETTEELPAVCTDPNRVPTAAEEIGWTYVNSMQRVLVVPCGGSTIFNGSVVTPASAVSCRANFCPQGASEERRSECQFECEIHPTFCKATCDADSNSAACQSCHQECQASCECQPFCEGVIRDAALCTEQGSKWMPYVQQNFDNILNAMITLFEISTTEGWVDVMYAASDSVDFYRQPVRDYQMGLWAPFFVLWIFLSFMFLINLSVGVIVDKFMDFRAAGKSLGMTPNQQKWMQSRKSLHGRMVFFDLCDLDRLPPMRKWVYHLTSSKRFEHVVVIAIIINTLFMTFKIFPSPTEWWEPMQDIVNYVCSIIFLIEAILKLFALRRNYWKDYWNCFDFACVLATLLGIAIRYGTGLDMKSITSVIRIFRIARLFRLLRFLKGLNRLFLALVISLPKLVNVVLILLLLLVLFGILGVSLFSCAKFSETLNVHGNFRDFFWAFTTLFRSSTGEAWNNIMHDLSKDETTFFREGTWCSPYTLFDLEGKWDVLKDKCLISDPNMCVMTSPFSRYNWIPKAYWISFTLLITLMIMNLVIAVILEGYEEGKSNPATEIVDTCVDIWKKYDPNHKLLLGIDKVNLFINEVLITANANATAVPAFVLNDDGEIDFGQFPMKYAKIFDLKVTDENQVSFISACRQVLKLNVIQDDMAMIHELDEADSQLNPAALAKLLKMETKTTGVSDSNEDLLHKIAAVKLQRRFRARSLYRKSIAADFTETQAFAASAFIGLQPQIGRRPSAADLRSSGAATSGHGGSQQVVMMCPPVAG